MIDMASVKAGDKVRWEYWHHLNSTSRTRKYKTGIVIRKITPKKKFLADWSLAIYALVQFEGNKNPSKVAIKNLIII